MALNEWGFAAEVKSWWDTALAADASELDHCSVEEQVEVGGSQKRSDLTVLTATGEVRLAGELRLPDHREHDPWDPNKLLGRFRSRRSHARATKGTAVRGFALPRPRFRPDTRLDRGGLHVESHGGSDGGRWGGSLRRTE